MPTALGLIFFLIASYYFLFQEDGLFGVLIVSSVFQASSFITFGERGVAIVYLVELFIIGRALINQVFRVNPLRPVPQCKWLLIFAAIAVASAFISPFLFAGIPVYDPLIGIDQGLLMRPALEFRLTNINQALYLVLHVLTAYSVFSLPFSWKKTHRAYMIAFYLVVLCVFAQAFCKLAGVPFPDTMVRNNPDIWDLATSPAASRKPGTFLEPSFAGAFMAMYTVGFIADYLRGRGGASKVVLSLAASGVITSGGSLLAIFLSALLLLVRYSPFVLPWYIDLRQAKRILGASLLLVIPVTIAVLLFSNYRDILIEATLSKGDSGSFFNRTTSDIFGLQLLVQTYGIGVGLGSNRASSLIASLASNVGIAGLLSFGFFYSRLLLDIDKEMEWLKWACFGLSLNMCIDIPDVTFPVFWVAIILAMQCSRVNSRHSFLSETSDQLAA